MKTTFAQLIKKHGRFTDTYVDLISNSNNHYLFIVQTNAKLPEYAEYYYKISCQLEVRKIEWYSENDSIPYYQVWNIECIAENLYKVEFDIGKVEFYSGFIDAEELTKVEYMKLQEQV